MGKRLPRTVERKTGPDHLAPETKDPPSSPARLSVGQLSGHLEYPFSPPHRQTMKPTVFPTWSSDNETPQNDYRTRLDPRPDFSRALRDMNEGIQAGPQSPASLFDCHTPPGRKASATLVFDMVPPALFVTNPNPWSKESGHIPVWELYKTRNEDSAGPARPAASTDSAAVILQNLRHKCLLGGPSQHDDEDLSGSLPTAQYPKLVQKSHPSCSQPFRRVQTGRVKKSHSTRRKRARVVLIHCFEDRVEALRADTIGEMIIVGCAIAGLVSVICRGVCRSSVVTDIAERFEKAVDEAIDNEEVWKGESVGRVPGAFY
ncbi:hypothetical protein BDZ85DRAFT_277399 [Elsinoe ampelina]|uniref:Uncharacterized protein n=1 Tax=Elsinoe ampelina TaxID=302913 RepID=A0A6A6GP31_9PEZI|nr:hypothetical protein BDZ85DRAFT_277399 [Elsinoe ampelina]